ncbi:MAG TPA: EamA family transporter, partial [Roseiarcus sp.]|nr:EamA family transporter [Roseiarcus sp.]
MPFTVFLAVLFSAALHAGWNALVKIRLDPFLAMTLICCVCGAIALPLVFVTGAPRPSAWPWIFASIVVHLGYYLSLAQAYRLADMMQAYPVARGAAPLMTAGASLLAVGDPISAGALAGIAVLAAGVLLVALAGHRRFAPPSRLAIVCALLTAATISAYTIIDGVGAREAGDPNAYAASL